MQRLNFNSFPKSDASMEKNRADTFAYLLTDGYFVSEDEQSICPEHQRSVVPTMMRFYQCPECAKTHLKMIKLKQQPMVDAGVADFERRQKLTPDQLELEDRTEAENRKRINRQQQRGF